MPSADIPLIHRMVLIRSNGRRLQGDLLLPQGARALIVFAHGSGSGRFSPRSQLVARALQDAGFATLLVDLLEEEESQDRSKTFNIPILALRLQSAADWAASDPDTSGFPVGYFGASTGAAAALTAAAKNPERIQAIVSRGGRPDLAWDELPLVQAPTLLLVGSLDETVVDLNQRAFEKLACVKEMAIISGATHLFPEEGALEEVAARASRWFQRYLAAT